MVRHSHESFQLDADSISFSNTIHQKVESYQTADHHCCRQSLFRHWPHAKGSKQQAKAAAGTRCLGNSSGDETGRSVILAPEHAGGFSLTNYSELFGGAGLVISLLNGGAALTGKSGRKTPDACDMSARETNIRSCCTKRVSLEAQFKRAVRPARITADIRIEANTLSSQRLRSCFRVLLNASRVSAIASRGSSVNREAKL